MIDPNIWIGIFSLVVAGIICYPVANKIYQFKQKRYEPERKARGMR
jgi:hypothetical protein